MQRDVLPERSQRPTTRILIADDHELARAGLRSLLAGERGLAVVGEASTGREAVAQCGLLQPHLVLMDVRMPDLDGLSATRMLKQQHPATSVVMVTMHENPDYLLEAIKAGAAGYVLKGATRSEILATMRRVVRGEPVLSAGLAAQLLRRLASGRVPRRADGVGGLTPREQEVLRALARGRTNRQIADELIVSLSTVKPHVEHIIAKLGVSDRTQAAVRAVELGLVATARG